MKRKFLSTVAGVISLSILTVAMAAAIGLLQQARSQNPAAAPTAGPPAQVTRVPAVAPTAGIPAQVTGALTGTIKPMEPPPSPTAAPPGVWTPGPLTGRNTPGPSITPQTAIPVVVTGAVAEIRIPGKEFGKYSPNSSNLVSASWGKGEGEYGLQLSGAQAGAPGFGIDGANNVYVLDSENRRVHKYDSLGKRTGTYIVEPGHEIAVRRTGGFYLLDVAKDFVVRGYSADGKPEATYPIAKGLVEYPIGVTGLSSFDDQVSVQLFGGRHAIVKSPAGPVAPEAQLTNQLPGLPSRGATRFLTAGRADNTSALVKLLRVDGAVENQVRIIFERRLASPYVLTDESGNIYLCAYLFVEAGPANYETLASQMATVAFTPQGQFLGKVEMPNANYTEAWKPVVVAPDGTVYQRQTSKEGVSILRWGLER